MIRALFVALFTLALAAPAAASDDCSDKPEMSLITDLKRMFDMGPEVGQTGKTAVTRLSRGDARKQVKQRLLDREIDPSEALPTLYGFDYVPMKGDCESALESGLKGLRARAGNLARKLKAKLMQAYKDCVSANFDAWFEANFPAKALDAILNRSRSNQDFNLAKRGDILREYLHGTAIIPGGHAQTGPTCMSNSIAMVIDHLRGRHGATDQDKVVAQLRASHGSTLFGLVETDCWNGKGDGSWGNYADARDCVNKALRRLGVTPTYLKDWSSVIKTVESGKPVVVSYYLSSYGGHFQVVPKGTEGGGYHASVLEGVFTEDGVRYVIIKEPNQGWPQVWREDAFLKSWNANKDAFHISSR